MTQMNLSANQKQPPGHRKQTCGCQGEGVGGRMEWKVGVSEYKLLCMKWVNNRSNCVVQRGIFSNL